MEHYTSDVSIALISMCAMLTVYATPLHTHVQCMGVSPGSNSVTMWTHAIIKTDAIV